MCKLLHGKDNVCCGVYWQPPLVQGFSRLQLTGAGLFKRLQLGCHRNMEAHRSGPCDLL